MYILYGGNIMNKKFKKLSSIALCTLMLAIAAPVGTFAESITPGKSVHASYQDVNKKIIGSINLKDYVTVSGSVVEENGKKIYKGTIGGEIESNDLFSDAFDTFNRQFKGKLYFGRPAENLVLFGKNKGFHTCSYKIHLPSNVSVDKSKILVSENSDAISKIYVDPKDSSDVVTIVMQLGNWNDYAGFFALVENEIGKSNHLIKVEIPFTIDVTNANPGDTLATITSKGECKLYYNGRLSFLYKAPIVDINAEEISNNIIY